MEWLRKEAKMCNLNIMIDFIIENLKKDVKVTDHVDMEIRLVCEEALTLSLIHISMLVQR